MAKQNGWTDKKEKEHRSKRIKQAVAVGAGLLYLTRARTNQTVREHTESEILASTSINENAKVVTIVYRTGSQGTILKPKEVVRYDVQTIEGVSYGRIFTTWETAAVFARSQAPKKKEE